MLRPSINGVRSGDDSWMQRGSNLLQFTYPFTDGVIETTLSHPLLFNCQLVNLEHEVNNAIMS